MKTQTTRKVCFTAMLALVAAVSGAFTEADLSNKVANVWFSQIPVEWLKTNEAAAARADAFLMAKSRSVCIPSKYAEFFPQANQKYWGMVAEKLPLLAAVSLKQRLALKAQDEAYVKYAVEQMMYSYYYQSAAKLADINKAATEVQKAGVFIVRRWLRRNGKSFVTKNIKNEDGTTTKINPVKEHMDELTAILNAPKFNGLVEWLASKGVAQENIPVGLDTFPVSDDAFAAAKAKVLNGEVEFTQHYEFIFRWVLGTKEYNNFIKLYNDGVAE